MSQHSPRSSLTDEIDANLKRAFDKISEEKVPDRFSDLLSQLRSAEQAKSREGINDDG